MSTSSLDNISVEEDVYIFPASFFQESLWFLGQLEPNRAIYNMSSTFRLTGLLNLDVLEQVLNAIVQRHESLRTTFMVLEGQLVQVISPTLFTPLQAVDLRHLPRAEQEAEAQRLATEEAQRPFDLTRGPLLRTTVLQLGAEEHMLLLTMHHITSDEWSMGVFYQEFAVLYEAFLHDQPSPLPQLPIQYADFAVWQRQWLQGEALATQLSYWRQQLTGAPALLELLTDHPRPAVQTFRGARHRFMLSEELADALKALSRRKGMTLFMTLLAAFNVLLSRYTGQTDIVVGSPIANRNRSGIEGLIGFFVNTLVLRTDLSENPTFGELLKRVREVALEAYAHQDLPFEKLVEELHPERNLSHNPLFQVMFALESDSTPTFDLPGLRLRSVEVGNETAKFDLSLTLGDTRQGLIGSLEYSTDLFEPATMSRMVGHFQTLLEGIAVNPEQPISELPLLTGAERHQLIAEWNETRSDSPQDLCVHQLFEAQVERTSDAVAVVFEGEQLTYRELNRRANQLAHYLRKLGVGPEVLVGICVERSLDMVVGLLGILKAGGAYVPLDPAYPKERLAFLLEDSQAVVLLTHEHLLPLLPQHQAQTICLDSWWPEIAQELTENVVSPAIAENLAYVIYTSGSTGKPKGVLVTHQNLVHSTVARTLYYKEPVKCFLLLSSSAFDSSIAGIFWTLYEGGVLVLPRADLQLEIAYLTKLIAQNQISHLLCLPALYTLFLEQARFQQMVSLRTIIVAGEPCPIELVERHYQLFSQAQLFNEYGPTEGSVWCSVYNCRPGNLHTSVPIGRPIANMQIYLLDTHLQPVPLGVPGELYIGGAGIAQGYINQPELTAERFIANPFSDEPDVRLYKTGDLARYLPDGNIEFLGRLDHQVKLRGFRIELGEIEAVLTQHPAVRQAVVVARENGPSDKSLVAYVVLLEKRSALVDDLKSHVMKQVPTYMVPSAFVLLETLPVTPNGKIDRRALPAPEPSRGTTKDTFVAPTLTQHYQLVQIWEDLLGVRPIGIKDNFFYLGGHSLLAARLVDRIEHVFGKSITLSTLFSGPTIEQLVEALQQQENADARTSIHPVQVDGSKRPFFFLHGDWTGGAFYCFALARTLGPDQPFYVLEPYKFSGLQSLPLLETVAAAHIEALRAIQSKGPYLLGGFCNGGLLAYEMARQLEAAGERVDLLALIVPSAPVQFETLRALSKRMSKLLRLGAQKQPNLFLRTRHALRHVYRTLHPSGERVQDFDKLLAIDPRLQRMFPPVEALYNDYVNVFTWQVSRYETGIYSGKITFFWASEEPGIENTWSPVTEAKDRKEIENHIVPGTHMSSVTEHIHDLAECLSMCLNRVQEEALSNKESECPV